MLKMETEEIQKKVLDLFALIKGTHDLSFLSMAYGDVEKGDLAIAVVELCQAGKLTIGEEGISLPFANGAAAVQIEEEHEEQSDLPTEEGPVAAAPIVEKESEQVETSVEESISPAAAMSVEYAPSEPEPEPEPGPNKMLHFESLKKPSIYALGISPQVRGRIRRLDGSLMRIGALVDLGRDGFERKYHAGFALTDTVQKALLAYFKRHGFESVPGWGTSVQNESEVETPKEINRDGSSNSAITEAKVNPEPADPVADIANQIPTLPVSRSLVFATDPIGVLRLDEECVEYFAELEVKTIADLVRNLGEGSENPGAAFEHRLAASCTLEKHAYAAPLSLEKDQLKALISLSGSTSFVFDPFGVLCDADSLCSKNGYTIADVLSSGLADIALSSLDLDPQLVKRLERKGATCIGDVLPLSEEEFAEKYQRSANSTRVVYDKIEKLKSDEHFADLDKSYEAFVSRFSRAAVMVSRDVRSSFEAADYPVREKELSVFALPISVEVLQRGIGHSLSVREVTKKLRVMQYLGKAMQAVLMRRLRANVATLGNDEQSLVVTLSNDINWRFAAETLKKELGKGAIFNLQDETFDFKIAIDSLDKWVESLPDNIKRLVESRINGLGISSCASIFQIDDQQVEELLAKVYSMRPLIIEERFLPMFETYEFTPSEFARVTGQTTEVFRYLADVSVAPANGKLSIADGEPEETENLSGSEVPAQDVEGRGHIEIDEESALEYVTKKYASEKPVLLHQLQQNYMQLATQHNFSASDLASLCDLGKFYGKLLDADCAIVCANPSNMLQIMVRYYDFSSVDFSGLTQLLAKQAGQNVECGFAYVIRSSAEFKEECEELGLRNDVEVHFVLSHYCDQVPGVEIGEYPLVKLGESSSEFQLRQLINEIGPINVTALEKEYSQRYGITGELFFDRYLPCVNDLKRGNQYYPSENQRVLSGEQRAFLREELDGSGVCCSADLLKTRYEVRFPKSSVDVLSAEVLASFARKLSDGLIFEYNTNVRRYFADLISGKVRFSINDAEFGEAVFRHQLFRYELERAKRQFEIVEIKDDEYVSTAPFAKLEQPISQRDLQDYLDSAIAFMQPGVPYTVHSLRKVGFKHKVDCLEEELGFGPFFYESLLSMGSSRLKKTRVGNCKVFCRMEGSYSGSLLVEWIVKSNPALELEELAGIMADQFGIEIDVSRLRSLVKRSDCYYQE